MSKKTVLKADLVGKKCMSEILTIVAKVQGIKSMDIDHDKCTLTVVGTADPVRIVQRLKKHCFEARIVSVEDDKPPAKKDPCKEACEKLCKAKCDKIACCKECKDKCEKACKDRCEKACEKWLGACCGGCKAGGGCGGAGCSCATCAGGYYCPPYYYYGGGACSTGYPYYYGCYEQRSPGGECSIQ